MGKREKGTMKKSRILVILLVGILFLSTAAFATDAVRGADFDLFGNRITIQNQGNPEGYVDSIQIILLLSVLTLLPSIVIMMTSFTRIIIILSFMRSALGTQQTPPNQVLLGLALFLTFFIMTPVLNQINDTAVQPFLKQEITQEQFQDNALLPIREFMFRQTRDADLKLFVDLSQQDVQPQSLEDIPTTTLIPAFMISELKTAFTVGFQLFIPFLIVDMVVASTLMAMGMMMLPPVMIALPFKLLLFILVDGWHLLVEMIVRGFK